MTSLAGGAARARPGRGRQPAGPACWLITGTAAEPGSQDRQQALLTRINGTADAAAPPARRHPRITDTTHPPVALHSHLRLHEQL